MVVAGWTVLGGLIVANIALAVYLQRLGRRVCQLIDVWLEICLMAWGMRHWPELGPLPLELSNPAKKTRLVILESPYAGDVEANIEYARACLRDSLLRGEAPIASHLLYTQPGVLDDMIPSERQRGIDAGLAWKAVAHASVVYTDRGITSGMHYGIDAANAAGIPVEMRRLQHVAA